MPDQYRKKPVVVEAMRLTMESFDDVRLWVAENGQPNYGAFDGTGLIINTLEGDMHASWDDWIIRGTHGEFYPCKPDIFADTYEDVTDA